MDAHRKRMQSEWSSNSKKYSDPIGMTGRRPVPAEFAAIIADIDSKFDLHSPAINRILDVGCNNGFLLESLNPDSSKLIGVDFCHIPLAEGLKLSKRIIFIQADAGKLPFKDSSFDRVICYSLFHYLPSQQIAMAVADELYRVTAKHGLILIGDIFSSERRHLIPPSEVEHWDSADRPFMHRLSNWLFISVEELKLKFTRLGARSVDLMLQNQNIRCPDFRYDAIIRKAG